MNSFKGQPLQIIISNHALQAEHIIHSIDPRVLPADPFGCTDCTFGKDLAGMSHVPNFDSFGISYKEYGVVSGYVSSAHCMNADFFSAGSNPFSSVYVLFAAQSFTDYISCTKSSPAWGIFFSGCGELL